MLKLVGVYEKWFGLRIGRIEWRNVILHTPRSEAGSEITDSMSMIRGVGCPLLDSG